MTRPDPVKLLYRSLSLSFFSCPLRNRSDEYVGVKIAQVNGESNWDLASRFGVEGYPVLMLLKAGQMFEGYDGVKEEFQMLEWLKQKIPEMKMRPGQKKKHDRYPSIPLKCMSLDTWRSKKTP